MPLDIDRLREIPVLQTTESVYFRTVHIPEIGDPDPLRVQPGSGRWPTNWTLYTGSSEAVAWAEYCRNHAVDIAESDITGGVGLRESLLGPLGRMAVEGVLSQRALYRLTFGFTRFADLMTPWAGQLLAQAGFRLESFYIDASAGYGDCPELAALTGDLDWEAMRVPSAAWRAADAWCVPVFEPGRPRLLELEELAPAASPTVATAYATTYPVGTRPEWLGPEP